MVHGKTALNSFKKAFTESAIPLSAVITDQFRRENENWSTEKLPQQDHGLLGVLL